MPPFTTRHGSLPHLIVTALLLITPLGGNARAQQCKTPGIVIMAGCNHVMITVGGAPDKRERELLMNDSTAVSLEIKRRIVELLESSKVTILEIDDREGQLVLPEFGHIVEVSDEIRIPWWKKMTTGAREREEARQDQFATGWCGTGTKLLQDTMNGLTYRATVRSAGLEMADGRERFTNFCAAAAGRDLAEWGRAWRERMANAPRDEILRELETLRQDNREAEAKTDSFSRSYTLRVQRYKIAYLDSLLKTRPQ